MIYVLYGPPGHFDVEGNEKADGGAARNSITDIRFEVLPRSSLAVTFAIRIYVTLYSTEEYR